MSDAETPDARARRGLELLAQDGPLRYVMHADGDKGKGSGNGRGPAAERPERRTSWMAGELLAADFPEPKWVVPGLLPVGLGLLAGRPKLGKSFLALQLAVAVGAGGRFLDLEIAPGRALYIALEDSARRMQGRLAKLGTPATCQLQIETAFQPLNAAGLGAVRGYLEGQGPALVVVDTVTRAFTGRTDWDSVGQATECLSALQGLALEHDCALLLVDHHRKPGANSADLVDDVLGSTAKAAVADVLWGLYRDRGKSGATLRVTGRDLEDAEVKVQFERTTCCWQRAEAADGVRAGSVQGEILKALEDIGGQATVMELAGYLDKDHALVSRELAELCTKGAVGRQSDKRTAPYILLGTPP